MLSKGQGHKVRSNKVTKSNCRLSIVRQMFLQIDWTRSTRLGGFSLVHIYARHKTWVTNLKQGVIKLDLPISGHWNLGWGVKRRWYLIRLGTTHIPCCFWRKCCWFPCYLMCWFQIWCLFMSQITIKPQTPLCHPMGKCWETGVLGGGIAAIFRQ